MFIYPPPLTTTTAASSARESKISPQPAEQPATEAPPPPKILKVATLSNWNLSSGEEKALNEFVQVTYTLMYFEQGYEYRKDSLQQTKVSLSLEAGRELSVPAFSADFFATPEFARKIELEIIRRFGGDSYIFEENNQRRSLEISRLEVRITPHSSGTTITLIPIEVRISDISLETLDQLIEAFQENYGFTPDEVAAIKSNPLLLSEKREALIAKYPRLVVALNIIKEKFQAAYARASDPAEKKALEAKAKEFLEYAFRNVLIPLWAGGPWSFSGQAKAPQNSIACGYFQQRIMEHLGFNLVANPKLRDPGPNPPDPDAPLQMGMLHTDATIWSYAGKRTPNLQNWEGLKSFVEENGEGLYLLGESSESFGHILFLDYKDGRMTVCHAGPRPEGPPRVSYNDAENYVRDFHQPQVIHAIKLDGELVRKWLTNEVILPKTKGLF